MTFTERLTLLLEENNLTRSKFLSDMKFGKNQITYWETKNTLPNQSTLRAIASYFHVSVDFLTGKSDERESLDSQLSDIDFALSGEIHKLSVAEKQDILDYIRFKQSQKNKK